MMLLLVVTLPRRCRLYLDVVVNLGFVVTTIFVDFPL